jgi:hypothetical protein
MKNEKLQEISAKADLIAELNRVCFTGYVDGQKESLYTEIERVKKSILSDLKELPL